MRSRAAWVAAALAAATILGCARQGRDDRPPFPAGVSWASLLRNAADLRSLARAPHPDARARLFSSAADTNKVVLANLAPEILGSGSVRGQSSYLKLRFWRAGPCCKPAAPPQPA